MPIVPTGEELSAVWRGKYSDHSLENLLPKIVVRAGEGLTEDEMIAWVYDCTDVYTAEFAMLPERRAMVRLHLPYVLEDIMALQPVEPEEPPPEEPPPEEPPP